MILRTLLAVSILFAGCTTTTSHDLVKPETIAQQKRLTQTFKLQNGIPVVYRQIENSDILELNYTFGWGFKDQSHQEKMVPGILFDAMTKAAKSWPKQKVFTTTEKYASSIGCSVGIEASNCSLSTINEYWDNLLPLFAALIKEPAFNNEDIRLAIEARTAQIKSEMQQPGSLVNDVVNRVFYPPGHGYFLSFAESLDQIKNVKRPAIVKLHGEIINAALHQITAVGSLPPAELKSKLDQHFGTISAKKVEKKAAQPPVFNLKQTFVLEDKKIPTAYINIKTNAPGMTDKDQVGSDLLFSILSEELENEIRTKRSLSYAVHGFDIRYHIGIGVLSASTPKPKETLEAMNQVIKKLKTQRYTSEEIERFKNIYATGYFLTLEEHSSLASTLSKYHYYFGSVAPFYDMPAELEKITADDIQNLANKYLVNFRMGVVFDSAKFKKEWADQFINANLRKNPS